MKYLDISIPFFLSLTVLPSFVMRLSNGEVTCVRMCFFLWERIILRPWAFLGSFLFHFSHPFPTQIAYVRNLAIMASLAFLLQIFTILKKLFIIIIRSLPSSSSSLEWEWEVFPVFLLNVPLFLQVIMSTTHPVWKYDNNNKKFPFRPGTWMEKFFLINITKMTII